MCNMSYFRNMRNMSHFSNMSSMNHLSNMSNMSKISHMRCEEYEQMQMSNMCRRRLRI